MIMARAEAGGGARAQEDGYGQNIIAELLARSAPQKRYAEFGEQLLSA